MYVLTIVFLVSRVALASNFASAEACEQSALRARSYTDGPQAVESAKCEPVRDAASAPR